MVLGLFNLKKKFPQFVPMIDNYLKMLIINFKFKNRAIYAIAFKVI